MALCVFIFLDDLMLTQYPDFMLNVLHVKFLFAFGLCIVEIQPDVVIKDV